MIPHPEKAWKGGEDALFENEKVLSVADGVGGWADHGVDPGIYSKKLCANISQLLLNNWSKYSHNPKQLIMDTHANNKEDGSSTLVVLTLPDDGNTLYSSYIGDSGYLILRPTKSDSKKFEMIYEFEEHTRAFNFPYQLGWGRNGDDPNISQALSHKVKDKDVLVVGTDGLFDNMSAGQVSHFLVIKKIID